MRLQATPYQTFKKPQAFPRTADTEPNSSAVSFSGDSLPKKDPTLSELAHAAMIKAMDDVKERMKWLALWDSITKAKAPKDLSVPAKNRPVLQRYTGGNFQIAPYGFQPRFRPRPKL